ncbi:hypothetical protein ACFQI7_06795 [Paenibacillus allorhizosphaerae]|uniref:DNA mismatch repair protein MutS n=1 Tax=Paenibacillus allorhizosphaerae TaxID=2849866 RepID=A0ABM8VFP6_9BACL|nr:hypothetical protein [Paenibacillus allorhizosphaerae]CAG7635766.1 DNA mismatch repair protein MutS [Paenibacillus allorhizosphaerae]
MENRNVSLLWPSEASKEKYMDEIRLSERCKTDLGVDKIVQSLCIKQKYADGIERLLLQLCDDTDVISYRLDILENFIGLPDMTGDLEDMLPFIQKLESHNSVKHVSGEEPLRKIAWQLEILSLYTECVLKLHAVLVQYKSRLSAEGLLRLLQYTEELTASDHFQAMAAELPEFRKKLQSMSSVTIGINLDNELKPTEAVFLSIEPKPFKEHKRSLVSSILGLKSVDQSYQGISLFHSILQNGGSALESALFKDLESLFQAAILPIGSALGKYIHVNIPAITMLELEIGFFAGAAKFIRKLSELELPMCKPQAAPPSERTCQIDNMTDYILSYSLYRKHQEINLGRSVVPNDIAFGPQGRVFILTGPNQGGKTTYTRAIGVAQILFQAGLYVPGTAARISPVDWIFTHFSEEEKPNVNNGRLGEESKRLSEIFAKATGSSLILLNESLSSTSPADSLYLARDVVKGIKVIGCRAVFATHLLELAAGVDSINDEVPGDSRLVSMVAGIEGNNADARRADAMTKRTYKITPGSPMGMSLGKDIAQLYGISFEQIMDTLHKRSLTGDE